MGSRGFYPLIIRMSGITRLFRAAPLWAVLLGLSAVPAALAAEDETYLDGGAAPTETEAEKRWFDSQSLAPLPGETEQPADDSADRAINLSDEDVGFSPSGDTGPRRLRLGLRVDF